MDKIDAVLDRFPRHAYNPEDKTSALYKLIKSIVDELNITMSNIDRINRMIDIDNTLPDDIYNRFGALLNIKQNKGESDEQYRYRLKVSVTSLSGGTANAIKYAVASGLNIDDADTTDRVQDIYSQYKPDQNELLLPRNTRLKLEFIKVMRNKEKTYYR